MSDEFFHDIAGPGLYRLSTAVGRVQSNQGKDTQGHKGGRSKGQNHLRPQAVPIVEAEAGNSKAHTIDIAIAIVQ